MVDVESENNDRVDAALMKWRGYEKSKRVG
jgi:hypothetical protein